MPKRSTTHNEALKTIAKTEDRPTTGDYEKVVVNLDDYYGLGRPNLTGILRQRKDKVADFVNAVAKWEAANAEGSHLVTKIANTKLDHVFSAESDEMDIPESLEKEVSKLENVISKFAEAAERIDGLCRELVALNQLDRSSEETSFLTSDVDHDLPDLMSRFNTQFQKELKVKRSIYQNIAHVTTRHQTMFYVSSWTHQPYIDDQDLAYHLCLMKKATGHG